MSSDPIPEDLLATTADLPLRSVEYYREIGSTNSRAMELAPEAEADSLPMLVFAESQTTGRGRGSNRWHSSQGSLTFSLLLDAAQVPLPFSEWHVASVAVGLAVRSAIVESVARDLDVKVKWPNDVLLDGRKVAGILLESCANRLVVGLGINLSNDFIHAPLDVQQRAISLSEVTTIVDPMPFLHSTVSKVFERLDAIALRREQTVAEWNNCCALTGRSVSVDSSGDVQSGTVLGINRACELVLKTQMVEVAIRSGTVLP